MVTVKRLMWFRAQVLLLLLLSCELKLQAVSGEIVIR